MSSMAEPMVKPPPWKLTRTGRGEGGEVVAGEGCSGR